VNAREKLNQAHVTGSLIIGAIAGLLTGSWGVFALVTAVLHVLALLGGGIRTSGRR
jgi:hypothetical protein